MERRYLVVRNFRFHRLIVAGAFFLVSASAAVEAWVGAVHGNRAVYMPSYDLLRLLSPSATESFEYALRGSAPVVWQALLSTVFQMPLWLLLGIISVGLALASAKLRAGAAADNEADFDFDIWTPISVSDAELEDRNETPMTIDDLAPDHHGHQVLDDLALLDTQEKSSK